MPAARCVTAGDRPDTRRALAYEWPTLTAMPITVGDRRTRLGLPTLW
ncbi:hypothetical protein ACTD5D_40800 [Nocardia takedensis]